MECIMFCEYTIVILIVAHWAWAKLQFCTQWSAQNLTIIDLCIFYKNLTNITHFCRSGDWWWRRWAFVWAWASIWLNMVVPSIQYPTRWILYNYRFAQAHYSRDIQTIFCRKTTPVVQSQTPRWGLEAQRNNSDAVRPVCSVNPTSDNHMAIAQKYFWYFTQIELKTFKIHRNNKWCQNQWLDDAL